MKMVGTCKRKGTGKQDEKEKESHSKGKEMPREGKEIDRKNMTFGPCNLT